MARQSRLRLLSQSRDSLVVGVEDWRPVTLTGGVASVIGAAVPGFFVDPFGVVHLRGYLAGAVGNLFILPEGYRPEGTEVFGTVFITAAGVVSSMAMPVSVSGLTFRPGR